MAPFFVWHGLFKTDIQLVQTRIAEILRRHGFRSGKTCRLNVARKPHFGAQLILYADTLTIDI